MSVFLYPSADIIEQSRNTPKIQGTKDILFGTFNKNSVWKLQKTF